MKEENEYILGTDQEELHRLGLQHQVWASEAQQGWRLAQFHGGQKFLDLGCGPGFCAKELAFIAGAEGEVTGVDQSQHFIDHLDHVAKIHHLNIKAIPSSFDDMQLADNYFDGVYCRWALAWLSNPQEILEKVKASLKPGGRMVIHEYYDWSVHQTEPAFSGLNKAIAMALKSFKSSDGEIDIGRLLPGLFEKIGMKVINIRPMIKMATVNDIEWQWPKSFYKSYFPRLQEMGLLKAEEVQQAMDDLHALEHINGATLNCPLMIEVIAEK